MKILLVEPEPIRNQHLSELLTGLGHDVLQPHQPDETIPALDGYWPDVVFMNFSLKNGTAVDLCSDIRELFGELPPVVIHSPKAEHRFFALRFPEISFLSSPFTQDDLRGAFDHLAPTAAVSLTG
jgi:DNA-binding response OmpR family regulator